MGEGDDGGGRTTSHPPMPATSFCGDLVSQHPVMEMGLFSFVFLVLQVASTLLILVFLWRSRLAAAQGERRAARVLLLPLYAWIMWAFALTILGQAAVNLFFPMRAKLFDFERASLNYSLLYASVWAAYHIVIEGISFLLLQPGAGLNAQRTTAILALIWGGITGVVHFYAIHPPSRDVSFVLQVAWEGLLAIFYVLMRFLPQRIVLRRPAMYTYAAFWAVFRLVNIASITLQYMRLEAGSCLYVLSYWCLFGLLKPFVIYNALLEDSWYWRGIFVHKKAPKPQQQQQAGGGAAEEKKSGSRHNSLKVPGSNASNNYYREDRKVSFDVLSPLMGQHVDLGTAAHIAEGMDSSTVNVINFAFLSLGKKYKILGAGGTSRVYEGKLKGAPVAIKMIYCMDLTPQVVKNFYEEAVVLSSLRHQNVVDLLGVTVVPPTLCLVMELCQANLYEFIHGADYAVRNAQPYRIDWSTRASIAIECARGVAHLHSQSPPILHTDIKSLNFLINRDGVVKLCDFEHCIRLTLTNAVGGKDDAKDGFYRTRVAQTTGTEGEGTMRVPETLNWVAPEVVRGDPYTQGADMYSLGVVLWEIFTGEVPFGRLRQANLRSVLLGEHYHPPLFDLPEPVTNLLRGCWRADPRARVRADTVVDALISIEQTFAKQEAASIDNSV